MAISKPSPHKSSPKQKQGKTTPAFKKKILRKRPTSSQCRTIGKEENEDLEKPIICYSKEERAHEVERLMRLSLPSFLKYMLPSHVSGGFWLGLPKQFCAKHLPMSDVWVTLVDESGRYHQTRYLYAKHGLSGGWKGFSLDHSLVEGDELFFELIKPCTFKVYIFRVYGSADKFLNSDFQSEQLVVDAAIKEEDGNAEMDASENNVCDELSTELLEGVVFSEKVVDFKDVKTLEDFTIIVNGVVMGSEIPTHIRTKYYHLCTAQKDYLHSHLPKELTSKLVVGMITEAVNVSDAIKAAKITTPLEELISWDKTLEAFEDLGMELGFLRACIGKLIALHSEQTMMFQTKMNGRAKLEEEMKELETKLANVKSVINGLDKEIKTLQVQNAGSFLELAKAPW